MNYLKLFVITQNYLSYFKDNTFNFFSENIKTIFKKKFNVFFTIYKDGSFETNN